VPDARPAVAVVLAAVDPAAGRSPEPPRLPGHGLDGEHLRVEQHAVGNFAPGRAAIETAEGTPPGPGQDPLRLLRIDPQTGDLDRTRFGLRGAAPMCAVVVRAPGSAAGGGEQAAGRTGDEGECVDLVASRQAAVVQRPAGPQVVRPGDAAADPDAP